MFDTDYIFDRENVQILDNEAFCGKRLIDEMIRMKNQTRRVNLQDDTEFLGGN